MSLDRQDTPTAEGDPIEPVTQLNGQDLKKLVEAALAWLRTNQQTVNSLNVFPVPDGDTGTNMLLTMQSAYNEIAESGEQNIGKLTKAVAQGALMGARGNSGVILSQLWRGFARALDSVDTMDAPLLVKAFAEAKNTAYKGVVRPVEGTILTVAKDIASASELALYETNDLVKILERVVDEANESVLHTPELLPVLKQAGVVDSGGKGLYFIFEGMLRHTKRLPLDLPATSVQPLAAMNLDHAMEEIEPGQDYEVVIDFKPSQPLDLEKFYNDLTKMGTSIQLGEGDGMYRMHIHVPTENRYQPEDYVMGIGTILKVAKENLIAQLENLDRPTSVKLNLASVKPGQNAVVVISPGVGISMIFASLGAAAIVDGGQTMNPSTEEILKSFENLPTDKIIILPNNKNITLASEAAASMTLKHVSVIPSYSVPQGLAAILRLDPDGDYDQLVKKMNESLDEVESGEITTATRTVEINGVNVKEGQVIVLHNEALIGSCANLDEACMLFLKDASTDTHERITLFYGSNIDKQNVNRIVDKIREIYPQHEIEVHDGGQPHYQFIIAVE